MRVINTNAAQLSNLEVLELLQEPIPGHLSKVKEFQEYRTAIHTAKGFLKQAMMPSSAQTTNQIQSFLEEIKSWPLTKMEKLTLVNTRPTNVVELMVVIEDCETRFSQEKLQAILDLLDQHLPYERPADPVEETNE
jgi:DNA-directed RNA polymerase subunit F